MENKIITLKDLLYAASRFNCYCWNNLQPLSRSSVSSSPLSPSSPTRILQQLLSQVAQETIVPFLQKRQRRKKSNSSNTTSIDFLSYSKRLELSKASLLMLVGHYTY